MNTTTATAETTIMTRIANGENPIVSWSEDGKASWDYTLCETVERLEAEGRISHPGGESPWNLFCRWSIVGVAS